MRTPADGIHTYRGRVVYARKPHEFTLKDLQRISRAIERTQPDYSQPGWVAILARITQSMLGQLLALVGLSEFSDAVYEFLRGFIEQILRAVPGLEDEILRRNSIEQISSIKKGKEQANGRT